MLIGQGQNSSRPHLFHSGPQTPFLIGGRRILSALRLVGFWRIIVCLYWIGKEFQPPTPEPEFFVLLRSPRIDAKEPIPPGCVTWWAGTATLFLLGSQPHRLFKNSSTASRRPPALSSHWREQNSFCLAIGRILEDNRVLIVQAKNSSRPHLFHSGPQPPVLIGMIRILSALRLVGFWGWSLIVCLLDRERTPAARTCSTQGQPWLSWRTSPSSPTSPSSQVPSSWLCSSSQSHRVLANSLSFIEFLRFQKSNCLEDKMGTCSCYCSNVK